MIQKKISFEEGQLHIIERYDEYGFKDQSAMVRQAIDDLILRFERERTEAQLSRDAEHFESLYRTDEGLTALTALDAEDFA